MRASELWGLDLTRATLNATLKYPWFRQTTGTRSKKWGAYHTEADDFEFARDLNTVPGIEKCAEAEIMDWADDVAYSVHDVEDFYRARLIPLDRIVASSGEEVSEEASAFLEAVRLSPRIRSLQPAPDDEALMAALDSALLSEFPSVRPYEGSLLQHAGLSQWKSVLIGRYIGALSLALPEVNGGSPVRIDSTLRLEVAVLKELTWHYVIDNPAMAVQRYGQRQVIKTLFHAYRRALTSDENVFPPDYRELLKRLQALKEDTLEHSLRLVSDLIASMTERQAIHTYHRLTGTDLGSSLERTYS